MRDEALRRKQRFRACSMNCGETPTTRIVYIPRNLRAYMMRQLSLPERANQGSSLGPERSKGF